jgi:hypothetical protein
MPVEISFNQIWEKWQPKVIQNAHRPASNLAGEERIEHRRSRPGPGQKRQRPQKSK